jgi:hypothetical protein
MRQLGREQRKNPMKHASLAKLQSAAASAHRKALSLRAKKHESTQELIGAGVSGVSGLALAVLDSKMGPAIMGVPSKPLVALAATAFGIMSKPGMVRESALSLGKAAIAIYAFEAYKTKSFIAGDETE